VKVALETRLLTRDEIITACHLVLDSGAAGLSNSTGIDGLTPDAEDIRLLCEAVGQKFFVKASGRMIDPVAAQALINAGADRLGVFDAGFLGPAGIRPRA
jgi:deoxyribose-phosphate aldolase